MNTIHTMHENLSDGSPTDALHTIAHRTDLTDILPMCDITNATPAAATREWFPRLHRIIDNARENTKNDAE